MFGEPMEPVRVLNPAPAKLFELPAEALYDVLGGPSLLVVHGSAEPPLFVSTLLHGNERSGWNAVCRLMANSPEPVRSLLVFVGNPEAARQWVRHLPDQPDFNRIWKHDHPLCSGMTKSVLAEVARWQPIAAVDLHNNTGRNPHYTVVTTPSKAQLGLAYLFADQAVLIEEPDTVLSRALEALCPSVALETGPVGDPASDARALEFLERLLALDAVPVDSDGLNLYRSIARVHVPENVVFRFAGDGKHAPLTLTGGMEAVNFHSLPAGTEFAHSALALPNALRVLDNAQQNVTNDFFTRDGMHIVLRRPVVPAMYTTDKDVVRQDCLCYLMERVV